ncbi:potassium transporter TrkG, partial [Lysobacter sp. D1-1-M9]|uniref:potassium transporter TrkG n=1 Tax=Novilysobacter longmucuonensis TaxID=3098603 RepID=UPI002FC867A2
LATRLVAQAENRSIGMGDVMGVLKLILAVTLAIEVAVAAVLALRLHFGHGEPVGTAVWNGAFHAVSAFNNAGFSTYSDSLAGFATDPVVLLPVMLAIMVGGIGFPVLFEMHRQRGGWARWSV